MTDLRAERAAAVGSIGLALLLLALGSLPSLAAPQGSSAMALPSAATTMETGPATLSSLARFPRGSFPNLPNVTATLDLTSGDLLPGNADTSGCTEPYAEAYDPEAGDFYVTCEYSNNVLAVNATTGKVVGAVDTRDFPQGITYDAGNHFLYVSCYRRDVVNVVNVSTLSLVAQVYVPPVSGLPYGIAYDPDNQDIYVATAGGYQNYVSVINGTTQRIVENVSTGPYSYPTGITIDPSDNIVMVTLEGLGHLGFINGSTNAFLGNVSLSGPTEGVSYDPSDQDAYVAIWDVSGGVADPSGPGTVAVVGVGNETVVTTVDVGDMPQFVTYDPSDEQVFVADTASNSVDALGGSPIQVEAEISTGAGSAPYGISADGRGHLLAADWQNSEATIISDALAEATDTVHLGTEPEGIVYSPNTGDLYIADYDSAEVIIVNASRGSIVGSVPVGNEPIEEALDEANGDVYVTNFGSNNVSVIDAQSGAVFASIDVGANPEWITEDPADGELYVSNTGANTVSVIRATMQQVVATIPVPAGVGGLTVDPGVGDVLVASDDANVTAIDAATNSVVANISLSNPWGEVEQPAPWDLAYDPADGELYVADSNWAGVTVLNGETFQNVADLTTNADPDAVAYDPVNELVYVLASSPGTAGITAIVGSTNHDLGNVSLGEIPGWLTVDSSTGEAFATDSVRGGVSFLSGDSPPYEVAFTESGLPAGTPWELNLSGSSEASTTPSITCELVDGLYTFSVTPVPGYAASPASGEVVVRSGVPPATQVTFSPRTQPLSAEASADQLVGDAPLQVLFNGTASGGIPPYSWSWDFGDETELGIAENPIHLYGSAGMYRVVLTVADTIGVTASSSLTIVVRSPPPILASVTIAPAGPESLRASSTASFTATISCSGGECPTGAIYAWSLSSGLGASLNATTGTVVELIAASTSSTGTLSVAVLLDGIVGRASVAIQIYAGAPKTGNPLDLPGFAGWVDIALGATLAALVAAWVVMGRRRRTSDASSPSTPAPPPPPSHSSSSDGPSTKTIEGAEVTPGSNHDGERQVEGSRATGSSESGDASGK